MKIDIEGAGDRSREHRTQGGTAMNDLRQDGVKRAAVRGAMWAYLSSYGGRALALVSTVILARLLSQEDFGVAGYALIVIGIVDVVQGLGITQALIYHEEDDDRTNTAFWMACAVGATLFLATWSLAPLAGSFFRDSRAIPVTRALALTFPIASLGIVHEAMLSKHLDFGRKVIPELLRFLIRGVTAVVLALTGFGAWSLIIGQLAGTTAAIVAFWLVWKWRPSFTFNREMVPSLFSYGSTIIVVKAFNILLLNADYLLVGRFLGASALGVYTLAFRLPQLLIRQFSGTISKVAFPAYVRSASDSSAMERGFLQTLRYVSLVTVPVGLGLALVAEPLVLVAFSDKWLEAIPILSALAIYSLLRSLTFNFSDAYKAQGRPAVMLVMSSARAVVLLPALYWAVTFLGTLQAVALAQVGVAIWGTAVSVLIARRLLKVPLRKMALAVKPSVASSAAMVPMVIGLLYLSEGMPAWSRLVLASVSGGTAYVAALWVFERNVVQNVGRTVRGALVQP